MGGSSEMLTNNKIRYNKMGELYDVPVIHSPGSDMGEIVNAVEIPT